MRINNKVEVELVGGLGNQLFGYFAGRYLAKKNESKIFFRIMKPNFGETVHTGTIIDFNLDGSFIFDRGVKFHRLFDLAVNKISRQFNSLAWINSKIRRRYQSHTIGFDLNLDSLTAPVRISGYFQTWKYCYEFKNDFESSFNLTNPSNWYLELRTRAINESVVMLHIRLGDYLEKQNEEFGSLSKEYYENALNSLPSELKLNPIWVFSDDIESARKLLFSVRGFNFVWIEPPQYTSPAESLLLMSFGAANIIANSTFSWWGAMLNNCRPVVIAPTKWFRLLEDPNDLIPESWIRVNSSWR